MVRLFFLASLRNLLMYDIAAQMWLLGRILPILVGEMVDVGDEKWENFLQLMEIVDLLFAPLSNQDDVAYLARVIEEHHLEFARLYPSSSVISKMHFMVHMPRLMLR